MQDPVRHRPVPYGPVMSRADGAVVPRWFELAVLSAAAFIAGFGLAALALAVVSAFSVVLVIAVSLNAGLLCVLGVLRLPERGSSAKAGPGAIAAVAITVVVVVAMTAINGWAKAQHVLTDRDPGVYLVTGKWLAEQGQLPVDAAVGPFARSDAVEPAPPVKSGGSPLGFFPSGLSRRPVADGRSAAPVRPPLPVAARHRRLDRREPACAVPPRAHRRSSRCWRSSCWQPGGCSPGLRQERRSPSRCRSRRRSSAATRSRGAVQLFLCAGIALAVRAFDGDDDRVGPAVVAGILLGASVATRVDALIALVAVPLWMSARWIDRPRSSPAGCSSSASAPPIGIADRGGRPAVAKPPVLRAAPHRDPVAGCAVRCGDHRGLRRRVADPTLGVAACARHSLAAADRWVGAIATVAVGAFAWFVRPHIETTTETPNGLVEFLQNAEGLAINSLRRYYEHSMEWLSWYLGPVTLALGVFGVAIAVWWVVLGHGRRSGLALALGVFLAPTVVYLWRARAVPDQMWVMRRFLPVTIPGVAIACFAVLGIMWRTRDCSFACSRCSSASPLSSCPRSCCSRCGARRRRRGCKRRPTCCARRSARTPLSSCFRTTASTRS